MRKTHEQLSQFCEQVQVILLHPLAIENEMEKRRVKALLRAFLQSLHRRKILFLQRSCSQSPVLLEVVAEQLQHLLNDRLGRRFHAIEKHCQRKGADGGFEVSVERRSYHMVQRVNVHSKR